MEPIYRVDILKAVKKNFRKLECTGLCGAITTLLKHNDIKLSAIEAFPKYTFLNAKQFNTISDSGYWWEMGKFGLFSGRRRFLNWLIKQYKDDKTDLRNL